MKDQRRVLITEPEFLVAKACQNICNSQQYRKQAGFCPGLTFDYNYTYMSIIMQL